jgi:hypothetical protein
MVASRAIVFSLHRIRHSQTREVRTGFITEKEAEIHFIAFLDASIVYNDFG